MDGLPRSSAAYGRIIALGFTATPQRLWITDQLVRETGVKYSAAIEYSLIAALILVVIFTGWETVKKANTVIPFSAAISLGASSNNKIIYCMAEGRTWQARQNGMCFLSDKPN